MLECKLAQKLSHLILSFLPFFSIILSGCFGPSTPQYDVELILHSEGQLQEIQDDPIVIDNCENAFIHQYIAETGTTFAIFMGQKTTIAEPYTSIKAEILGRYPSKAIMVRVPPYSKMQITITWVKSKLNGSALIENPSEDYEDEDTYLYEVYPVIGHQVERTALDCNSK